MGIFKIKSKNGYRAFPLYKEKRVPEEMQQQEVMGMELKEKPKKKSMFEDEQKI